MSFSIALNSLKVLTDNWVDEYVKNLIEKVGQDGGFILGSGSVLGEAPASEPCPEKLIKML